MKAKRVLILFTLMLFLISSLTMAETKKLEQIGRYTFVRIKGEVPTQEVMKILLEKYKGDIKYGFDLAGYGDLYFAFLDQIENQSFEEAELPIGQKFMWMLFRSHGKVKIVEDLEWAGKEPLPVFVFNVVKDHKNYMFIMPKPCGNISLVSVERAREVPICDIVVDPEKANINDPITVDMSGSKNAEKMVIEVYNEEGRKLSTQTLTMDNPKWQTKFSEPGKYDFKPVVYNYYDEASSNPCEASVYINNPPTCMLTVMPDMIKEGEMITLDASGSQDPDGTLEKAVFEISDEVGNVIAEKTMTTKPYIWEYTVEEAGMYSATVAVYDDFGAVSGPCDAQFEVKKQQFFFLVEAGGLIARGTYTGYAFGRLGFMYQFVPEQFSFVLSGGGAYPLVSGDLWKPFFMANAVVNAHFSPAFIGAGLGYSTKEQDVRGSGLDLVGNFGLDVFSNGSIFFEGRLPLGGENREISETHKLLLGFRLTF
ncbi:MAG: hypothetical protein GF421_04835 [Candidatus Aminicenantes bacterium]|nr:hypothetical protein [Candidatus Aminicenantes bacterium]